MWETLLPFGHEMGTNKASHNSDVGLKNWHVDVIFKICSIQDNFSHFLEFSGISKNSECIQSINESQGITGKMQFINKMDKTNTRLKKHNFVE